MGPINRYANANAITGQVALHMAGDLLRRPAFFESVLDVLMHVGVNHFVRSAARQTALVGQSLGLLRPVTALARIALQLAMDRAAVPPHQLCDFRVRLSFPLQPV
jgi:hypothetical protein